jgi:hypothetical protein
LLCKRHVRTKITQNLGFPGLTRDFAKIPHTTPLTFFEKGGPHSKTLKNQGLLRGDLENAKYALNGVMESKMLKN